MVEWVEYFKRLMGRIERRDKGGKRREWRIGNRK